MTEATDAELATADVVLSIAPPDRAVDLAGRLAGGRGTYVDLNAVRPATAARVGDVVTAAGATFVDGGIIGGPPTGDGGGPTIYLSGAAAGSTAELLDRYGLTVRVLDGGIGAASALKLSYAGLTKGTLALGAAMVMAATRAGVADALRDELADSQRHVLARLSAGLPGMLPKAYRWAPEMREIAGFIGGGRPDADVYRAMADLFADLAGGGSAATLVGFAAAAAGSEPGGSAG